MNFDNYLQKLRKYEIKENQKVAMHWSISDSSKDKYGIIAETDDQQEAAKLFTNQMSERTNNETSLTLNQLAQDDDFYYWKVTAWEEVINAIKHHKNKLPEEFTVVDICCGNGFLLHMIKHHFPKCKALGIDLFSFVSWVDIKNNNKDIDFIQMDVEDFIKIDPFFKFDIGMTYNTLRGWNKNKVFDIDIKEGHAMLNTNHEDPRNNLRKWLITNSKIQLTNSL